MRDRSRSRMSQTQAAAILLAPFLITYTLFLIYPFFRGVWISLHDWNLLAVAFNPDATEFVGFRNYERVMWGRNIEWGLFAAPFWQITGLIGLALSVILRRVDRLSRFNAIALGLASLLAVPGVTISALVLAAAMNRETRAMGALRTLFFLSQVLSVTVVTLIWQIMFSPRQGLIANITETFGGTPINWLTDQQFAMAAIVIATIWWSLGIAMILFLAGLQDISQDIYEAAALDNARGVRAFWYVTLPNLKRTITLVVILQIILHFQVFGQSHLMTQGGPNDTTQVLVRYIYQTGFRDSELGRASAMAVFLFVIMGTFSVIQFIVGREKS